MEPLEDEIRPQDSDRSSEEAQEADDANAVQEEAFKVMVRVRPPLGEELNLPLAVDASDGRNVKLQTEKHEVSCTYDVLLGPESTQEDVYSNISPLIGSLTSGINCTVFAYGQTGSGKTHTMLGPSPEVFGEDNGGDLKVHLKESDGVIPGLL